MPNKINIETSEVKRILMLHENYKTKLINEQSAQVTPPQSKNRQEAIQFFANAKSNGCLTDPNLVYDQVFKKQGENRVYIKGPSGSMKGMVKRIYDDFSYELVNPTSGEVLKKATWSCVALQPKPQEPIAPQVPKLNANQLKVLELLKPFGWFHEPAPTDVEVERGLVEKVDLKTEKIENTDYSKWFLDFPAEFFVYRKKDVATEKPDLKNCKEMIKTYYNAMKTKTTLRDFNNIKNQVQRCKNVYGKKRGETKGDWGFLGDGKDLDRMLDELMSPSVEEFRIT